MTHSICSLFKHYTSRWLQFSRFVVVCGLCEAGSPPIAITPPKPRSESEAETESWLKSEEGDWTGRLNCCLLKGCRAAHVPGGWLADNNVAQRPNTPLNPPSGADGVTSSPLGFSVPAWDISTPLFSHLYCLHHWPAVTLIRVSSDTRFPSPAHVAGYCEKRGNVHMHHVHTETKNQFWCLLVDVLMLTKAPWH